MKNSISLTGKLFISAAALAAAQLLGMSAFAGSGNVVVAVQDQGLGGDVPIRGYSEPIKTTRVDGSRLVVTTASNREIWITYSSSQSAEDAKKDLDKGYSMDVSACEHVERKDDGAKRLESDLYLEQLSFSSCGLFQDAKIFSTTEEWVKERNVSSVNAFSFGTQYIPRQTIEWKYVK